MRLAHLDCSTGVSGDKFLSALLDAGIKEGCFTLTYLSEQIDALIEGVALELTPSSSYGIAASQLSVIAKDTAHARSFKDIRELIKSSTLPKPVKATALRVFTYLAEAEGLIHSIEPENVTFHEVGAYDSIVDIIGVCLGLHSLKIEAFYASPPALGSGTVMTAHGEIPLPAPATTALLLNKPTSVSSAVGELTTPTGAALLLLAAGFGPVPPMTPEVLGYGMGTRDIGQANICRIIIGEHTPTPRESLMPEQTVLLETNIDHITPEAVGFAGEELLAEGALDVWVSPVMMKKSRAALTLFVLAPLDEAEHFATRMSAITGTLGIRVTKQQRFIAEREFVTMQSAWGPLTLKYGSGRYRAEHEDIARIARDEKLEYAQVLSAIEELIEKL